MKNSEYWQARERERLELIDISVDERIEEIKGIMSDAVDKIEHDIFKLYQKYGKDNELKYQDTLFYLTDNERKEFQKDLKYYVETFRDESKAKTYKSELQALSTRARVKRLEALKANIQIQATELERLLTDKIPSTFNSIYQDSYFFNLYSQCLYTNNLGLRFDIPSPNIIRELLNNPWSGKNYSEKVWNIANNFNYKLDNVVTAGLIKGEHPNIIAKNLRDAALGKRDKTGKLKGGQLFECKRLVRTEAAFIVEQATKKSYDDNNVKEYEYLATLDFKTSFICRSLDGKVFKVKDSITGVNYPPMHCFCRSTTVPVIKWEGEDNTPYKRIARDPITGRNNYIDYLDYSDWKDEQYAKYGEDRITAEEKKIRNKASDKIQHSKYRDALGEFVPKNFSDFQNLKYNLPDAWDKLKSIYIGNYSESEFADMKSFFNNLLGLSKVNLNIKQLPKKHYKNIMEYIDNSPVAVKNLVYRNKNEINFKDINFKDGAARYSPKEKGIYIDINDDFENRKGKGPYTTVFHEMGHLIDHRLNNISVKDGKFRQLIIDDVNTFINKYMNLNNIGNLYDLSNELSKELRKDIRQHSISDLFGGVTDNTIVGKFKHSNEYWKNPKKLPKEAFAHFFEATLRNDEYKLKLIKEVLPKSYSEFLKMLGDE
ncbi:minor capsid protein [Clostridium perfringens]